MNPETGTNDESTEDCGDIGINITCNCLIFVLRQRAQKVYGSKLVSGPLL